MASNKPQDFKPNSYASDGYKQYILVLEKKIRNLEKRKSKLDDYKVKQNSGIELNEDQKLAVSHYSEVLVLLETLNDLHKSYVSINNDFAKNLKKQIKKSKMEKEQEQTNNIMEVLKLYYLFSALHVPKVKEEILDNINAPYSMTEEEYKTLTNITTSIFNFPTTSINLKLTDMLGKSLEHIIYLLSKKEKPFMDTNTTYKSIKLILEKLNQSGYFDSNTIDLNSNLPVKAKEESTIIPSSVDSDIDSSSDENDGMVLIKKPDNYITNGNTKDPEELNSQRITNHAANHFRDVPLNVNKIGNFIKSHNINQDPYSATTKDKPDTRTLNDLLASFQSGFQFMQDSLIEPDRQAYFS